MQAAVPFVTADRWQADNDRVERELRDYRIRNQREELAIKALDTPQGIELAARRLGYVMPGERPLGVPEK
jgi:cell division protein FtsB